MRATDPRAQLLAAGLENIDRPAVTDALDGVAVECGTWDNTLRNAAVYPAVLALAVLGAAAIVGAVGLPALAILPTGTSAPRWPMGLGAALSAANLMVLSALAHSGARVPILARGWRRLDGFALLASTRVLSAAGVPLPAALRASAIWCGEPQQAVALARALDSADGRRGDGVLLDTFETTLLLGAARGGVEQATLGALCDARRAALGREISAEAGRIELLSLLIAGAGVLSVAAGWIWAYSLGVSR